MNRTTSFFLEFWPLVAAEKLVLNWHIEKLCNELQELSERVFLDQPKLHDLICNCPPGTSKSSIFSILWQPWVWTRMPSARFITGSYAESLALDLARKSRDVVMSEKYQTYFPEVQLREDQNTKGYFATTKGGFRKAVGVGGSVIGMHAHFIVIDDPIDPLGALSDLILKESNDWMRETLSQRKVDKQVSVTSLVMQRLHQIDPTGDWLERGGKLRHLCLPGDTDWPVLPEAWKDYYADGLFDPRRFSREVLTEAEQTLGEVGYAGQYGQQPSPRGGSMFRVDRLLFEPTVPVKWKRGPVRYFDKAASQGSGSYTVGVKMALDQENRIWILDVLRGRWEAGERERRILSTARLDGKYCRIGIEQEPGGSGKEAAESAARAYAREGFRCYIDVVRGTKEERAGGMNNEIRADTFATQVNTFNVVLVPAPWNKEYIEELRLFPNSKFKDQVDACLIAGTQIITRQDSKPIESIRAGDEVLTRFGYRRVLWAGKTGDTHKLVSVQFANGAVLTGTLTHPVLTQGRVWTAMEMLSRHDRVLTLAQTEASKVWKSRQSMRMNELCSMESPTVAGFLMADISGGKEAVRVFTAQSGVMPTVTYPLAVTFITRIKTPLTTQLEILSASQRNSTDSDTQRISELLPTLHTWSEYGLYQSAGMALRKGEPSMLGSARLHGRSVRPYSTSALSVASRFLLGAQELGMRVGFQCTAPLCAANGLDSELAVQKYMNVSVPVAHDHSWQRERRPNTAQEPVETVPVYNLEVEGVPEFFANGILVHNSTGGYGMLNKARMRVGVF